jgi:hypothetical protein
LVASSILVSRSIICPFSFIPIIVLP